MANSPVEIVNSALTKVGSTRITALTDDNDRARIMNEQYSKTRKSLLRSHPWNFAKKRISLGLLTTSPLFEFDNYFELPLDVLRVLSIDDPDEPWAVEGRKLATNVDTCMILYISNITDTQQYDPHFDEAFSWQLAADTVYAFQQSATFQKSVSDQAKAAIATARSYNAQEGTPPVVQADTFQRVRL